MTPSLFLLALLGVGLLLLAARLRQQAQTTRVAAGLPAGEIIYADTATWQPTQEAILSRRWGLVGKPDYLVEQGDGVIPVEVKSSRLPRSGAPHEGHVLQLAAYCALVADTYGRRPPYGYVHYRDATVKVPYTPALEEALRTALAQMRAARHAADVQRSHQDYWRCRRCGLAYACGSEALASE